MILYYYKIERGGEFTINLPSSVKGVPQEYFIRKLVITAHKNWCNDISVDVAKRTTRSLRKILSINSVDTNNPKETRKQLHKW
jgi:hypothetical protein